MPMPLKPNKCTVFGATLVLMGLLAIACVMARMTLLWREHRCVWVLFFSGELHGMECVCGWRCVLCVSCVS